MDRVSFLSMLGSALPTASANKWDECEKSVALPYDRPLGLTMRVLDGPDFTLLRYRGQAVLLHIFATWCGPCNREMPHIVEAAADYAARGLAVIGIDSREKDDTVRAFRKRYAIAFPIAMDADGSFVQVLEAGRTNVPINYPVSLFIDPTGYLYCDEVGGMGRDQLRYRLERFLAAAAQIVANPSPKP
jgi:thiol-disulfide isomerase/thioredoxin